jgi:hypothetical protein
MEQETQCQEKEQDTLLEFFVFVTEKKVKAGSGTTTQEQPKEIPAVEHCDYHESKPPWYTRHHSTCIYRSCQLQKRFDREKNFPAADKCDKIGKESLKGVVP